METTWLTKAEYLDEEIKQAREEGKDVSLFIPQIDAIKSERLPLQDLKAEEVLDKMASIPVKSSFSYIEPSTLHEIRSERTKGLRNFGRALSKEEIYNKIYGAWLGRCAGCLLGKPVEGFSMGVGGRDNLIGFLKETNAYPLNEYICFQYPDDLLRKYHLSLACKRFNVNKLEHMPEDDDLNYTVMGLRVLQKYGKDFTPQDVGEAWLYNIPFMHTCTAERVAYRNLSNLLMPPKSATHHNPYREWIGAQIRADIWGYVTPGNPQFGAELAWRDASISHVKNGLYGEMFVAAMISTAFVTEDIEAIISTALSEIPANSRLTEAIRDVLKAWNHDNTDWNQAIDMVYKKYGHYSPVHTINNAMLVCIGLLYGNLDFGRSIGITVMGALDTDCNGATVGSIVGLILGANALPQRWISPLNNRLETGIHGYNLVEISKLAKETMEFI